MTGEVADLSVYAPARDFDVLLCDRVLHMLPYEARIALVNRVLPRVRRACVIADERRSYPAIIAAACDGGAWEPVEKARGPLVLWRCGASRGLGLARQT